VIHHAQPQAQRIVDLGGVSRPTAAEINYALGLWLGVMNH
jgi:hypothetical protein